MKLNTKEIEGKTFTVTGPLGQEEYVSDDDIKYQYIIGGAGQLMIFFKRSASAVFADVHKDPELECVYADRHWFRLECKSEEQTVVE